MAGGKETPRQKMIGMMYLVLTALLALNVTRTVLDKFIFINNSLERAVVESSVKNTSTVERIKSAVDESGNRGPDVAVLKNASDVREKTSQILQYMDQLKEEIITVSGGRDEEKNIKSVDDEENLANLMINKKKGKELQAKMNEYAKEVAKLSGLPFKPIALDAKDHPTFQKDPNQKKKDFSELNFAQTPLGAGLATISQFQIEIVQLESTALDELARKVGAADLKFDKIVPMVRPESKIVAAGTKYVADLFIAASSSGVTPTMTVNGRSIPVDATGMGKVEIPASASNYDNEGVSKQSYEAAIRIQLPGGRDTTFTQRIEYLVAKPVIQVQSAALQALYLNCGNELNVQVPALGSSYNPSFSGSGGAFIQGNKKGIVTIIPSAAQVKLNVASSGNVIGTETFSVKPIPKPTIRLTSRGKELNMKQGEPAGTIRTLNLDAVPDDNFASVLPKDARYRVSKWEVTLARGTRAVAPPKTVTSREVNISDWAALAKPGDRIVIEVKEVQRMNFRDNIEPVSGIANAVQTVNLN